MSDDRPAIKTATAVAETLPERLRRVRGYDSPEPQLAGECVVCRGQLVPQMRREPFTLQTPLGRQRLARQDGWYCERCGLRYHHLPSRPPSITDDTLQH